MSENDLENQATSSEKNNVQLEDNLTKPMGVFNYIGTLILFLIPILGLFFALVWSFAPVNKNRKNLARAILVLKLICILLLVLLYFIIINKLLKYIFCKKQYIHTKIVRPEFLFILISLYNM